MLGADRVIAIDRIPERLAMAKAGGAEILNYEEIEVGDALKEMTGGRGPYSIGFKRAISTRHLSSPTFCR